MLNKNNIKNCDLPNYDRNKLSEGILHIGIGAFHRAHQVFYINELLNTGDTNALKWGYVSGTIRSNEKLTNNLDEHDCFYTLSINSETGVENKLIGALKSVYFAGSEHSQKLIEKIINPNIKIITYTITEKGYYVDLSTQKLSFENEDIIYDLNNFHTPKTAIGITVAGLHNRWKKNGEPITLLSCDNMPNNGNILKQSIIAFANKIDKNLGYWIEENCTFPSCMVDRIVPAVTNNVLENIASTIGQKDPSAVATEKFTQWVIEDRFANGRPNLEKVGVEFVQNVEPFEKLKLTMLNGSHSLIAYLGAYAGLKTVDEVISKPEFYHFIKTYMLEVAAPLIKNLPKEISIDDYADKLLARFGNPHLKHKTEQIATDGSKKIPQRWLESLTNLITNNKKIDILAIGLAGWILFNSGKDQNAKKLEISDPFKTKYAEIYQKNNSTRKVVEDFISIEEIFPKELSNNSNLINKIIYYINEINSNNVLEIISKI